MITVTSATNLGGKAMLAGDVDGNGTIETADKDVLASNLMGADPASDLNNDNIVNLYDLAILNSNLEHTTMCP